MCSIPGSERPPGGDHGNPLQYSCLENPMDREAWQATLYGAVKSQIWLSNWALTPECEPHKGWGPFFCSSADAQQIQVCRLLGFHHLVTVRTQETQHLHPFQDPPATQVQLPSAPHPYRCVWEESWQWGGSPWKRTSGPVFSPASYVLPVLSSLLFKGYLLLTCHPSTLRPGPVHSLNQKQTQHMWICW